MQDNSGRAHFNGGQTHQTNYTLDGFNISDPVTGRLETRVNIETIQSMEVESSRFSAENGRGSAGDAGPQNQNGRRPLALRRHQFHPRRFDRGRNPRQQMDPAPGVLRALSPRAAPGSTTASMPSTATIWFTGLPMGQNRTSGLTTSDLTRFQVNLTPGNILTGSFLYNLADTRRLGLSFVNPAESTTNRRQATLHEHACAIRSISAAARCSIWASPIPAPICGMLP